MAVHADWPFVVIHWEPVVQTVWMQWRHSAQGEPLQRALNVGLDLLTQRSGKSWLSDHRHVGTLGPVDRLWISQDWLPRAGRAGLRHLATVTPRASVVPVLTLNSVLEGRAAPESTEPGITNAYFHNVEAALLWLRRQSSLPGARQSITPELSHDSKSGS